MRGAHPTRYAKLAIEAVTRAVEHGWKDLAHMESDPDLAPIRDQSDYKVLVEKLKTGHTGAKEEPGEQKP